MGVIADKIRRAIFGREVRDSIADGIEVVEQLREDYDNQVINAGNSNAEIVDARGGQTKLKDRLDNFDEQLDTTKNEVELNYAKKTDVARVSSGTPLFAPSTIEMTDTTKNYVNTTDGCLYIYSSGSWVNSNVKYQEKGLSDGQVTVTKTKFFDKSNNLFNKNSKDIKIGYYLNSSGEEVESKSYYISHKIDVEEGEKFTIDYAEQLFGAFYDSKGVFISKIGTSSGTQSPFSFVAPSGAKEMRVCGRIANIDTDMVVKGETYPSLYEEFYLKLNENVMLNDTQKNEVVNTTNDTFFDKVVSDNLLNLDDVTEGMFLSGANEVTNSSYFTTNFIEVKKGDIVRYYIDALMGTNNKLYLYDENDEYISNVGGTAYNDHKEVTLNIDNVKKVRLSYHNSSKSTAMITINKDYPTSFQPYTNKKFLNEEYSLNENQKNEVKEIADTKNVLTGKIISCNGDSIMAGAGLTGGFAKIIAERNNMIYENIAVGGATITAETTYASSGLARHWICRTINKMREDAHYVVLEGAVNDSSLGVPMGEITEDFTSPLDDTTFCGAFESMLKQAIERFPGKKIGYVFVHKMSKGFDSRYDNNYYTNAKKICEKWGIPYKDLNVECPPLNYIPYLKSTYTKDGDGWHPNEEGYMLFYVDQIEAWLKTL